MSDDSSDPVSITDGLTDQQRRGAELAAAGWSGVDIGSELGVRPETVSRWKRLPAWQAAYDAIVAEVRGELEASLTELAGKALSELEALLGYDYDPSIRLRASVALLNMAGVGRVQQTRGGSGRFGVASSTD